MPHRNRTHNKTKSIQELLQLPCAKVRDGIEVRFETLEVGLQEGSYEPTVSNICILVWTPMLLAILNRQWYYLVV